MNYNAYTSDEMKKFYEYGISLKEKYSSLNELCEYEDFDDTDKLTMICAGFEGDTIDFTEKYFLRIGEPINNGYNQYRNSFNYADNRPEKGISILTFDWFNSIKAIMFGIDSSTLKKKGVYKIKGFIIAYGGDDEPLIYATDWA